MNITNLAELTRPNLPNRWTAESFALMFENEALQRVESALNLAGCNDDVTLATCRKCGAVLPGVFCGSRAIVTANVAYEKFADCESWPGPDPRMSVGLPQVHHNSIKRRCPHCKETTTVYAPEA
jgi:hypothetical protein